jgi:hypothetical protein
MHIPLLLSSEVLLNNLTFLFSPAKIQKRFKIAIFDIPYGFQGNKIVAYGSSQ